MRPRRIQTSLILLSIFICGASLPASAQTTPSDLEEHAGQVMATPMPAERTGGWHWGWDTNVFLGFNYQHRKFTDFHDVESQNWTMLGADHPVGAGRFDLISMFSLEPFTLRDIGSHQVFQTGETFHGAPLIDYQHPHDLFMALGARYDAPIAAMRLRFGADVVGDPTIGPPAFMHRPSAAENPQAPLSHHHLDSTHITHGVLRAGVERAGFGLEGSWFHGREPDEDRIAIEMGALDSWALRGSWAAGGWQAQISGARLKTPEVFEPGDLTRLTGSIGYTRTRGEKSTAFLAAWGENRELFGTFDAYLVEATVRPGAKSALYSRAELVTKSILGLGFHVPGFPNLHPSSRIGALTIGYVRDIASGRTGRFGIGADITVYSVPDNLHASYGLPASFHLFLRYRPMKSGAMAGMN